MEGQDLHVMMFPFFAFGHISPFVQLADALSLHNVHVTLLSASSNIPRITSLSTTSSSFDIVTVDIPPIDGLPPSLHSTSDMTFDMAELLKLAVDAMKPQLHDILSVHKPHIILHDFSHHWMSSVASPLGVKTLFFSVFSALSSAFLTVPDRRDSDLRLPPPGFPTSSSIKSIDPHEASDMRYVFMSFHGGPSVYDRVTQSMRDCDAIVCKSCREMEGPFIDYLSNRYGKPVLLTGPLVQDPAREGGLDPEWKEWLDGFEEGSVVFCSFGSETFLDRTQIEELVTGLENTGLPFLVVLNFPKEGGRPKLKEMLPEGFEERVKGRGRAREGWTPQKEIMAHASVGCYVSHAGLSSVMEGLINGCRLVLLPMRGDQFFNARLCEGDLGVGVKVRRDGESGGFDREGVREAVVEAVKKGKGEGEKWRGLLVDGGLREGYVRDLVRGMKGLVGGLNV
ncbi:Anthocyanidin 3-O-glucosyltransferase [Acorus calamus]|uniref:Glycosyltransferase n=1 Tax=Acorus calamus TaxID=4465 RepID=A0AAV9C338_ACOCL|nr:Anthocyanidin 3-O-glucosyltransferase [Acorus calamus]